MNQQVLSLYTSGVSQRQIARILRVNLKTVIRKFKFLAGIAKKQHAAHLNKMKSRPVESIQFDDLVTNEHTKCKPLSVALAVSAKDRKILAFQISQMPANGPLAQVALAKYGPREDQREEGWERLMNDIKPYVSTNASFTSDQNPHYPKFVRKHFPKAKHYRVEGRRACVVGQGELKKIGFDPLFSLNHTCAMLRAHLNRLFRRTWCTTKKREALADHIALYVSYHNRVRT